MDDTDATRTQAEGNAAGSTPTRPGGNDGGTTPTRPGGNDGGIAPTRPGGNDGGTTPTRPTADDGDAAHQPTIYDVARSAGVSIASVSRVLNDRRNPLPETKERVMQAVAELGFIPDGAARALSARLKEVVGVVIRRPTVTPTAGDFYADEEESLQFPDLINRGIEVAAQRRDFNLLVCSVDTGDHDYSRRIFALARKSDGLILHDQVLDPDQLARLSRQVPIVTLAGVQTATTTNVGGDNVSGMRELARHLVHDHGFRTLAYLSGHAGSPDDIARHAAFGAEVTASGADFADGPRWQGNYYAAGGARVIDRLLAEGAVLPQAIACANDQTALGVVHALTRRGLDVPGDIAVTGFDDIPVARHLRPRLTTVRQPIQQLGATAFEAMYAMVCDGEPTGRNITLPTGLVRRESCGCAADPAPAARPPAG